MKTLANVQNELVIVISRGIVSQLIWTSKKEFYNNFAKNVYGRNIGTKDALKNTKVIEVKFEDCEFYGLKKNSSESYIINTSKLKEIFKQYLVEENEFDVNEIISNMSFKPRHIVLWKKDGAHYLTKSSVRTDLRQEVYNKMTENGYTFICSYTFGNVEDAKLLKYFAFMDISKKNSIESYLISDAAMHGFLKILQNEIKS